MCCSATSSSHAQRQQEIKEAKERHWNQTVTKMVAAKSRVADTVENVLNKTASTIVTAKQGINTMQESAKARMASKLASGSSKWATLRDRAADKMVETKVKVDTAKDNVQAKVAAGVERLTQAVSELLRLKTAVVGKVVGAVTGKVQQVRSNIQQHKAAKSGKSTSSKAAAAAAPQPVRNAVDANTPASAVIVKSDESNSVPALLTY